MTEKGFREFEQVVKLPEKIIIDAIEAHGIDALYVGFSGGKDSAVVAHFAATMFPKLFKGCIFCDTGISVKEAKSFVIDYCREMGWKLFVVHPKRTFEQIVQEDGFPGPTVHTFIMRYLKYIPMRHFIQRVRETGKRPAILSGVRQQESVRRGINATDEIYKDGKMIFISPMLYKSDAWMYQYYIANKLKRSPVYDTLHISGDCLCGCFSKPGEAKLIELFHPDSARQIKALEKWRKSRGLRRSTWGKQAGMTHASEQDGIDKFLCNDCINTQENTSDDFLKELDEVEAKLKNV